MSNEKKRILEMLAAGDIDADEAERLLNALERPGRNSVQKSEALGAFSWLKIKVYEGNMDKPKVNVRIPLSILKIGAKIGARFNVAMPDKARDALREKGIDIKEEEGLEAISEIIETLEAEAPFDLVHVDEENEKVIVRIE